MLAADSENTVALGGDPPEIKVEVENGGDVEESDVNVTYTLSGGATTLDGRGHDPAASTPRDSSRSRSSSRSCPRPGRR